MIGSPGQGKDDRGLRPFRTDARLIVSYPKSGRTWLRFALIGAGVDATFTHAGAGTNRREIGYPFRGIPIALQNLPLVFLHRDPIDTAVSMYYQITRKDLRRWSGRWFRMLLPLALRNALPPKSIDAFVLDPVYGIEKICAYNKAWLDHLEGRGDCLVLTYEAMRQNPARGFQRMLDFWSETASSGEALADASSFDKMKSAEAAGKGPSQLRIAVSGDTGSAKVRKGKVHGYLDELRSDTILRGKEIAASYKFDTEL